MDYNMPAIEGIDWEKAYQYLPTKDVLTDVLVEFVKTASKQTNMLLEFKDAVMNEESDDNFASFRIQAHAMKASLRSLGADLFDEAFALEAAGRQKELSPIMTGTDSFASAYMELAERLKQIVGECDIKSDFDENTFFTLIDEIKRTMDAFDVTALQEAFRSVSDMDTPEKYNAKIEELEIAVRELDSDRVAACCDALVSIRG